MPKFTRRAFLAGTGVVAGAVVGNRWIRSNGVADADLAVPLSAQQAVALAALGLAVLRAPDSLPNPDAPPGTPDPTLANIEQIVVCMLENHSYDNFFGCLPPGRRFVIAGTPGTGTLDGLTMKDPDGGGPSWNPYGVTDTNPYTNGSTLNAFQMPTTVQISGQPSQDWVASHEQYAYGSPYGLCSGFALSPSGPVAMGYWGAGYPASSPYGVVPGLPFTYALARTFPVADRWFCDLLGQTDPNRRYLIAGTSNGMTDDIAFPTSAGDVEGLISGTPSQIANTAEQDALLATPANGTIFDRLEQFGITWCDYTASYPTGTTAELYPLDDAVITQLNYKAVDSSSSSTIPSNPTTPTTTFFDDCANGNLPQFSLIDMNYSTQSQENPQDISVGEAFLASVVEAIVHSPQWLTTMLVITYDEHGGYYDHVPPPVALAPDAIRPVVAPGESLYDGFWRYGFRVPGLVVSPYAIYNGVTHTVLDHASVLAMVERKWNPPAMTYRDANANDLTDFLDTAALQAGKPTIPGPFSFDSATPGPFSFPPPGPSVLYDNEPGDLALEAVPPAEAVS